MDVVLVGSTAVCGDIQGMNCRRGALRVGLSGCGTIRPLVDAEVLTDVIQKAQQFGNAVSSMPYNEQIFLVNPDDESTTKAFIPRETIRRVCTPQAYQFGLIDEKYHEAFDRQVGIYGSHYTNTMMVELGVTLHFAAGSDKNIKLTTPDDLEIFKGYLKNNRLED